MKEEINELKEYRKKLSKLSEEEIKKYIYLKKIADGTIEGPQTGFPISADEYRIFTKKLVLTFQKTLIIE